jgi:outer membrane autotransporter protein
MTIRTSISKRDRKRTLTCLPAEPGAWYLKPLVDAAVTELDLKGFSESGGGGAALTVPGRTDTVYSVSPGLEIGGDLYVDKAVLWRPFVRAGVTWQDTDHFLLDAGFLDAPQGISPFTISTKLNEVIADVSTGVDVIQASGVVMRLQYDGRFAQDLQQNSVSVKGSVPF